jgi:Phosphotransferase enzyme family
MAEQPERDVKSIAKAFQIDGKCVEAAPYGNGHINETYASVFETSDGQRRFIHQRINETIFTNVAGLMDNVLRVTEHVAGKVSASGLDPRRHCLTVIPTLDGKSWCRDQEGAPWRTYIFIENAVTYETVEDLDHVENASRAFGGFQKELADIPGSRLIETIPDFHNTRKRFENLKAAQKLDKSGRGKDCRPEIDFVLARQDDCARLVSLLEAGELPERVTHNDTKLNNVMLDPESGQAVCVIDLDTCMPGLTAYDFGDSIRIGASTAAEDEQDLSKVSVSLDMFERITRGYLDAAGDFLTPKEVEVLAFSGKLLTLECGSRFLADHLDGDNYFRIHRQNHNLDRCRTQFKMVADMETKMSEMEEIVKNLANEQ